MLDSLTIADFDLDVSEVLLVHRNKFVQQFKWSEYLTGRGFDGLSFCLSGRAAFDFFAVVQPLRAVARSDGIPARRQLVYRAL